MSEEGKIIDLSDTVADLKQRVEALERALAALEPHMTKLAASLESAQHIAERMAKPVIDGLVPLADKWDACELTEKDFT